MTEHDGHCPRCGAAVIVTQDARERPLHLDPEGLALVLPLAFVIPGRIDGFTRRGDRIAGRHPNPGEDPTWVLYLQHTCERHDARRTRK